VKGGKYFLIAHKSEHVLYMNFPENWRLCWGRVYLTCKVIVWWGKYRAKKTNNPMV